MPWMETGRPAEHRRGAGAGPCYANPRALSALRRSELFVRVPTIADRMPLAAHGAPEHERAAVFVSGRVPSP